jgi:hypothetical protein
MTKAIVELVGSASYQRGSQMFSKGIPRVVEGEADIAYYRGQEGFSVRMLDETQVAPAAKVTLPVESVEPEVDDSDLPLAPEEKPEVKPEPQKALKPALKKKQPKR